MRMANFRHSFVHPEFGDFMSMKLTAQAMDVRVGNPLRKLVLLKLCDNANDKNICWPSLQYVADQCEISTRSVMTHIAALESSGFLRVANRSKDNKKISNVYLITLDEGVRRQTECVQNIEQVQGAVDLKSIEFPDFSSEFNSPLIPGSSESGSVSSEGDSLLGSEGDSHKPVIQPVKEPVNKKIYKKISLERLPEEISPEVAVEFIELRERLKKPLTQGAFDRSMREALRGVVHGLSADEVIRECVDAGWRGIKLQWVLNRRAASASPQIVPFSNRPPVPVVETRRTSLIEQLTDTSWAK